MPHLTVSLQAVLAVEQSTHFTWPAESRPQQREATDATLVFRFLKLPVLLVTIKFFHVI